MSFRASVALLAAVLALPAIGAAAEEHAAHHAPSIVTLLWPALNFAVFAYVLYRFAWPIVKNGLADRRRLIEHELGEADGASRAATAELEEIRRLRSREKEEGERIVAELRAEAEHERAALVEAARHAAERIRADARRLGEHEAARAAQAIRAEVAARVIERAAEALRRDLGPADQQRFVRDFLAGVERRSWS